VKNPRGFGSIYKMKDYKRKKPWRVLSPATKDIVSGKSKRYSLGTYRTKLEAMEALVKYNKTHSFTAETKETFFEIAEKWKDMHLKMVSISRRKNIISRIKKMNSLYNLFFSQIKLQDLQNFFNNLNVSSGTKREYKSILNLIFKYAYKHELIEKNPVAYIELGKYVKVRKANVFTIEEIRKLWKYQSVLWVDTILILIYTGLRIGELLSIKKENVFIKDRYMIGGSKSEAGENRIIPLHMDLIPLIKKLLNKSKTYLIEFHEKKVKYGTYIKYFSEILKNLNFTYHRVHDTRHTFATIIGSTNANQTSIKNIIGHSSYLLTEKVYTHKRKEDLIKAIDCIELK